MGALLLMSAAPAMAAPVTLKCFLERSAGDGVFLFSLNDSEGRATIQSPLSVFTKPASFSPETVKIHSGSDDLMMTSYYEINRTDLSIKSYMQIGTNAPFIRKGTCELYTPPNRAF